MQTDYIEAHLEEMMRLDPDQVYEEEDFFYLRKFSDGTFKYHLFPELNLKLIENSHFMIDFDRWEYKTAYQGEIKDYNRPSAQGQAGGGGSHFDRWIFMQSKAFKHETEELVLVYETWINLWCGAFQYLDEGEKTFRVNQLIQVLQKMREPISNGHPISLTDIRYLVLSTTTEHGHYRDSIKLYDQFKDIYNIRLDPRVELMIKNQEKREGKVEIDRAQASEERFLSVCQNSINPREILDDDAARKKKQAELVLAMGSVIYKKICYKLLMKDRTLVDKFDPRDAIIKDDSVQMQLMQICIKCNG
jgi:hypothetical protein